MRGTSAETLRAVESRWLICEAVNRHPHVMVTTLDLLSILTDDTKALNTDYTPTNKTVSKPLQNQYVNSKLAGMHLCSIVTTLVLSDHATNRYSFQIRLQNHQISKLLGIH